MSEEDYNFMGLVVGPPSHGKTTLAGALVRRHFTDGEGIVLAHDPNQQYRHHGCAPYEDVAAWRRAAAKAIATRVAMPRGASLGGSASEVTELANDIGTRCNRALRCAVRILAVYDEGSLLDTSGSTYVGAVDNQLMANRRHRGVGLLYLIQRATQLPRPFFDMSTDVYVFRQPPDAVDILERALLLRRGELAHVAELPRHDYVHVKLGDGIVEAPL